jgi:hypothetical protein
LRHDRHLAIDVGQTAGSDRQGAVKSHGSTSNPCSLTFHVYRLLEHVVGCGDHLGICGIGALRDDQFGEFGGDIDIGAFDRLSKEVAGAVGAGGLATMRAPEFGETVNACPSGAATRSDR